MKFLAKAWNKQVWSRQPLQTHLVTISCAMPKRKAASHDVAQSTPSSVSLSVRWALSGEILSVVSISPEACEWEEKAWHSMYKIQKIDYVPHPIRTQNKIPGKFPFLWEEDSFSTFSSDWAQPGLGRRAYLFFAAGCSWIATFAGRGLGVCLKAFWRLALFDNNQDFPKITHWYDMLLVQCLGFFL